MNRRLVPALLSLVIVPLALLALLGWRVAADEETRLQRAFLEVIGGRMRDLDTQIQQLLIDRQRELRRLVTGFATDATAIDDQLRRTPEVTHGFVQDGTGKLVFPPINKAMGPDEKAFLTRWQEVFDNRLLLRRTHGTGPAPEDPELPAASDTRQTTVPSIDLFSRTAATGTGVAPADPRTQAMRVQTVPTSDTTDPQGPWFTWHWDHGLHLLFWQPRPDGGAVGVELARTRLLADLIARLPDASINDRTLADGALLLVDGNGKCLYRWGALTAAATATPLLRQMLAAPLASWHLQYHAGPAGLPHATGGQTTFTLIASLVAVGLVLGGLALWLYLESTRELRDAAQRVSFVNQVSHELRTPLTNIRLHAELLAEQIGNDDTPSATPANDANNRLGIIIAESQRLTRLIHNVLTFARHQRGQLTVYPRPAVPDDIVRETIERFRPALQARNVQVILRLHAPHPVLVDADALEQMVGNLVGNVEKYAAGGGQVFVTARQQGEQLLITVRDLGPGIPADRHDDVFAPFVRLSDRLTDGVAGTGIGLTIARELARLHGGDLLLTWSNGPTAATARAATADDAQSSTAGAAFTVIVSAPPTTEEKHS